MDTSDDVGLAATHAARVRLNKLIALADKMGATNIVEGAEAVARSLETGDAKKAKLARRELAGATEKRWKDAVDRAIQAAAAAESAKQEAIIKRAFANAFGRQHAEQELGKGEGLIGENGEGEDRNQNMSSTTEDEGEGSNPFVFDGDSESLAGDDERHLSKRQRGRTAKAAAKRCTTDGCQKFASFGLVGSNNKEFCAYHVPSGSFRVIW